MSDQVVYTSKIKIERVKGPLRRAYLPQEDEPVLFGVHSEIAEHYGVDPQVQFLRPVTSAVPRGRWQKRWERAVSPGSQPPLTQKNCVSPSKAVCLLAR